jgi:Uma2 family endonuclease
MPAQLAFADQMTVEEFLAFTDARPDGEKWELIEGAAIMSPSPTDWHQVIVNNLSFVLTSIQRQRTASWYVLPGIGTRVPASPNSLPQPDVFIKEHVPTGSPVTDDAMVISEVLSKSNTPADQAWRKRVYDSVPNCRHYVTIATTQAEVVRYDRATGWKAVRSTGIEDTLDLPHLSIAVPLAEIYRRTPMGA